jgi:1-hydroxycarotenoid 3,4-desaturase
MAERHIVVVGAGVGGLAAALMLAARGLQVTVLERDTAPGGKLRAFDVDGEPVDAGPTVFTMRWVFEALFADAGLDFDRAVPLARIDRLARHAWTDGSRLDLHADLATSADAIGRFGGADEARRFLAFAARARDVYRTLEGPFIRAPRGSTLDLVRAVGLRGLPGLMRISPFETLWGALGRRFRDPRLRQLFGRYATYCGSSPFLAPATLMLVAHVEMDGVWLVEGGMHRLAAALADAARARGVVFRFGADVAGIDTHGGRASGVRLREGGRIGADAVVVNGDAAAVAAGLLGPEAARAAPPVRGSARSLSAVTWLLRARSSGFPLDHHNVFFSRDYRREFERIFGRSQVPDEPTVYVCAQDRGPGRSLPADGDERLLCLINAPADGDRRDYGDEEIRACEQACFDLLSRCGLALERTPQRSRTSTPALFDRRFPGTGGALYGPASHGWRASFQRPGSRTRLPGLYLAGGSTHPGPGVPMAALSGRLAAACALADLASTSRSVPVAMRGGTSTP